MNTGLSASAGQRTPLRALISALRLAAALTGYTMSVPLGAQQADAQIEPDTGRITLDGWVHSPRHALTLEDIVGLRDVQEPTLSPDGRRIAFLVRQGFLDCNCYHTALYVAAVGASHSPVKVVEEELISNLRWTPDASFVTYLSSRGGSRQVWRVSPTRGTPEQVFAHAAGAAQAYREQALGPRDTNRVAVDEYEWSPDGLWVAFVTRPASDSGLVRRVSDAGVVYDDDRMHVRDIQLKHWTNEPAELWLYDVEQRGERRVWRAPQAAARSASYVGIQGLAWSPDAKNIAISYAAEISAGTGLPTFHVGVVDLARGTFRGLVGADSMYEWKPVWSPDGKRIAFACEFSGFSESGSQSALGVVEIESGKVRYLARGRTGQMVERLWWIRDGTALAFEATNPAGRSRPRTGLYTVSLASSDTQRLTAAEDHISACSVLVSARVACIRQNPNLPPDPVVLDLDTGGTRSVAAINPEMQDLILSPVTELHWTNKFGVATNGYLIRPYDYTVGKRYPLLIILYGFQGRFVTAAEWITSYPAQALAREGFAVLLWNYPRSDSWAGKDYELASAAVGYGPLATLESAVSLLAKKGLVDTTRVGLLGWSYGGFLTEFALTHSSRFRVAAVGNDGDFNPGAYWALGWRAYRMLMEKVLGGPPSGRTLRNWEAFSPALNAHRVRAPVLIESSAEETTLGLEMFGALRSHGVPVEFVIYPDEGHILAQPVHRLASMQRNLDWFSFWLLKREDPDPVKREQYERWRAMRHKCARMPPSRPQCPSLGHDSAAVGPPAS